MFAIWVYVDIGMAAVLRCKQHCEHGHSSSQPFAPKQRVGRLSEGPFQ